MPFNLLIENGRGWSLLIAALTSVLISVPTLGDAQSGSMPVCPFGTGNKPVPEYAASGDLPNVVSWSNLKALPDNCHIALQAPARLTVALAGYFDYSGTVSDLAARLGAISESKGMLYWSVSDDNWRKLITDAFALKTTDADSARADFTSQEILSGQILYSAQKDSRSWGTNVLGMRVVSSSAYNLVFKSYNETAVRMGPIKLIRSEDAQSVLFLGRVDDKTWEYYSLAVIKRSVLAARKKSLINRQYALFRLLTGQKQDEGPPLAP